MKLLTCFSNRETVNAVDRSLGSLADGTGSCARTSTTGLKYVYHRSTKSQCHSEDFVDAVRIQTIAWCMLDSISEIAVVDEEKAEGAPRVQLERVCHLCLKRRGGNNARHPFNHGRFTVSYKKYDSEGLLIMALGFLCISIHKFVTGYCSQSRS